VAVGGAFRTLIVTVAIAELTVPSFTVNVKLSLPFAFAFGVYVTVRGEVDEIADSDPSVGCVAMSKVSGLLSGSDPVSVMIIDASSATVTDCAFAMGGRLLASCGHTVTVQPIS
jgi:hypothetical protein